MNTERAMELLKDFKTNGIALDAKSKRFSLTLEYQDVIGRSTRQEIRDFYKDLDLQARRDFTWVNFYVLSQDMALSILKDTVIAKYKQELEEVYVEEDLNLYKRYEEREKEINAKIERFDQARKWVWRRINKHRVETNNLKFNLKMEKEEIKRLREKLDHVSRVVNQYIEDSNDFNRIKKCLGITLAGKEE